MTRHPKLLISFALLAFIAAAGCSDEKTQIVNVECSAANPFGACEAGLTCFAGTCVSTSAMCSPTNLSGTCPTNMSCFSGGCVMTSALCSPANPSGPCVAGSSCMEGACVLTPTMCSTANPTGVCPTGKSCDQGVCVGSGATACTTKIYTAQPVIGVDTRAVITVDGLKFKDSSGDGKLDVYEDWRLAEICRAKDLVAKLSVPEKVGLMSETSSIGGGTADGSITQAIKDTIQKGHVRQALIRLGTRTAAELAVYLNNVQKLCEAEPWGVPFVVTADPVHGFGMSTNATTGAQTLSASTIVTPWPYPLGLGAINDAAVTKQYGDNVRKDFMAMGFRWQLGPMADLGTEPRWARVQNVFGENAFHVSKHVKACIQGFQGEGQGGLKNGIAATMKHFPGAGPNEDGKDSHSSIGKWNVFPGAYFEYHQIPFRSAIDAGAAAVMPCYSIFKDQLEYDPEQVGTAFSKGLVTTYLKEQLGFSGMVTSDWGTMSTTSHGVEALTRTERVAKFVKAGSNQLGSDSYTLVQAAYDEGLLTVADIDGAAVKILEMSFKLGVFENPYVDPTAAGARTADSRTNGFVAQKKAIVLLRNTDHGTAPCSGFGCPAAPPGPLPISATRFVDRNGNSAADPGEFVGDTDKDGKIEVYFDGVVDGIAGSDGYDDLFSPYDYTAAGGTGALPIVSVATAAEADVAVLRITARKGTYFGLDAGVPLSFDAPFPGAMADSGLPPAIKDRNRVIDVFRVRDGYKKADGSAIAALNPTLKIVLVMHMDRPGIVRPFINGLVSLDETAGVAGSYPLVSNPGNIRGDGMGGVDAFLVEFGAFDRAVLDVLFNKNVPTTPAGYVYGSARLPMEIPSSDAEVDAQYEDVPADTWSPTYLLGAGIGY